MSDPRIVVCWPFKKDLHGRRGFLRGAEEVVYNGLALGLLFDVELDVIGHFWLPRDVVRLDTKG